MLTSADVLNLNMAAAMRLLHLHGSQSRAAISKALDASRSAVGDLLAALADLELISIEEPASDGRVGRPSPTVSVGRIGPVAACLAPGPDASAQLVCLGLGGTVLDRRRVTPDVIGRPAKLSALLTELEESLPPRYFLAGVMTLTDGVGCEAVIGTAAAPVLSRNSTELLARGELTRGAGVGAGRGTRAGRDARAGDAARSLLYVGPAPDYDFHLVEVATDGSRAGSVRRLADAIVSDRLWATLGELTSILSPDVLVVTDPDLTGSSTASGRLGAATELRPALLGPEAAFHGAAEVLLQPWWQSPLTTSRNFRRSEPRISPSSLA